MQRRTMIVGALILYVAGCGDSKANVPHAATKKLYLDVHELGKVSAKDVAEAHKKDLATEGKYDVDFKAYWVDEKEGKVYCLAEAPSAEALTSVHKEAHGLVPKTVMEVSEGR
jgi:Protein of unknown function (DUF4242)